MKIYSSWSPNPQKVLFAAKELGLQADIVEVDLLKGEQRAAAFTTLNPMQKVPVIEDDELTLWESNAILVHFGERTGRLWPAEVRARADALRWLFFEARHLSDSIGNMWFYESVAPRVGAAVDVDAVARARKDLPQPLAVLNQHLARRQCMLEMGFSLVDCSVGADLLALSASTFDWSQYPAVRVYVSRLRDRNGWRATNPQY